MPAFLRFLTPLLALSLVACAVGPDYKLPEPPADKSYTSQPISALLTSGDDGKHGQRITWGKSLPLAWWRLFDSVVLNKRVSIALGNNPEITAAAAAMREAQANAEAVSGRLYPSLSVGAGKQRQRSSLAVQNVELVTPVYNVYNASIDLSYGVDLTGITRRTLEAHQAQVAYQRHQLRAAHLALASNVVIASINFAALGEQLKLHRHAWKLQSEQLAIMQAQRDAGQISAADFLPAQAALVGSRVRLRMLEKQTSSLNNQLAVLMGQTPAGSEPEDLQLADLRLPENIPVVLPAALARQRPDIQAAESLLHQASAKVGVASARLYPNLVLSATYGSQSNTYPNLFKDIFWNVVAALTQPLFNGGRLRAQKRAEVAAFEVAMANYQATVLRALQNVADALQALEQDSKTEKDLNKAAVIMRRALEIGQQQYKTGAISRSNLLMLEQQDAHAQADKLSSHAARLASVATLFAAMGSAPSQTAVQLAENSAAKKTR